MKRVITSESIIKEFINSHGERYDYSKVKYINDKTPVEIICKLHGSFLQIPYTHKTGHGCSKCRSFEMSKKNKHSTEKVIDDLTKIYKDKYNFDHVDYIYNTLPIKVYCNTCEEYFHKSSTALKMGIGCPNCGILERIQKTIKSKEKLISQFKQIHNDLYDYSLVEYKGAHRKITIKCNSCNKYIKIEPNSHLKGGGCKYCGYLLSTFRKEDWIKKAKGRRGIFYIINCWNKEENFYKSGITFISTKARYNSKLKMPYNWKTVYEKISDDLSYIWDLEKIFMKFNKINHYNPKIKFYGCKNECFK